MLIDQKIEAVKRRIQSPHIGNFGFVISSIASALTAISSLLSIFYFQTGLWVGIYLAIFLIFTSVVVVGGWILAYVLDLDLNITSRFNILTLWLLFSFRNLRNENISLRYKKGAFRLFESD
ncbi:MAG: hypothetical protein M0Z77_08130 [Thermoplasmatales archaeon]|nr:hypothetical protein [Thermoplasmatales archaeon]